MKLRHFPYLFCLIFLPFITFGQFSDNFDDGDLTNNPTWEGDSDVFIVNSNNQLQLNATVAGTSLLYITTTIPDSTIWELYFKADFAPSGNNGLRVYLQSDDPTFVNGNGYYFEFGESGADDALNFYRMDNGVGTLLGSGQTGGVGTAPAEGRLKISRTITGDWEVNVDYEGGNILLTDLTFSDNVYPGNTGNYFGLQCEYTSGNITDFFFDDINLAPLLPDLSPPAVVTVDVISGFELDVYFDESLDENSAEQINNYTVDNGIGNPVTAILDNGNPSLVHLTFSTEFPSGQESVLDVNGVQDVVGNAMTNQTIPFTYYFLEVPQQNDILINEFMADQSPPVGLPQVEFVELYNNTDKIFDLVGSTIASGGSPQVFENYIFEPGEYLILCDDSDIDSLASFGNIYAFSSFPSLSNDGDEFVLKNEDEMIVDSISYDKSWYQNTNKDDGGWSIELINPEQSPCVIDLNWRASENPLGGTPGTENSVLNLDPSTPEVTLDSLVVTNTDQLILLFNVVVDEVMATDPNNYTISPNLEIASITPSGIIGNEVLVELNEPIAGSITYTITANNISDCIGNSAASSSLDFLKPGIANTGDILINEILFNPETGGKDFVEFYNNSSKVINLNSLSLANIEPGDTSDVDITTNYLLMPQAYVVLTEDPTNILENYTVQSPEALLLADLPPFDDDLGNVTLFRRTMAESVIIDEFDYDNEYHSAFLDDEEGVSLERINFDEPTQNESNWHSAAASAGYATPTYINSQFADLTNTDGLLTLTKNVFSPDADGFEDLLFMQFNTGTPGYNADIKIYDSEGRMVKHLLRNELIPIQGTLRWDGITDELTKAGIGIYILFAEFISDTGDVKQVKETFVLATRL